MMMMMMMTTILVMVTVKKKSRGKRASYRRFQHPREEFTCCPPFRRGSQHNIYILQGYRGRSSLVFFSEALGGWLCDRRAGLKRHILDTIIFPLFRSLIVFVFVFLKKETHKTKRIESNRNETKRNETKRSEAKRNETKQKRPRLGLRLRLRWLSNHIGIPFRLFVYPLLFFWRSKPRKR